MKKILLAALSLSLALCMFVGCGSGNTSAIIGQNELVIEGTANGESGLSNGDSETGGGNSETNTTITWDVYKTLMQQLGDEYAAKYQTLVSETNTKLEAAYAEVLGEEYTALITEYSQLVEKYNSLVSDFYASADYIDLKAQLADKMSELKALTRGSDEYLTKLEEVRAVWTEIETLVDGINTQITEIYLRAAEIEGSVVQMYETSASELYAVAQPIIEEYYAQLGLLKNSYSISAQTLYDSLDMSSVACEGHENRKDYRK